MFFTRSRPPAVAATDSSAKEILDLLKAQQTSMATPPLLGAKNVNALVIAGVIGAVAFLWTSVNDAPKQNALLSTQVAEIRTTTLETKTAIASLSLKFDSLQKDGADTKAAVQKNAAQIDALNERVTANTNRISQLEQDTR